MIFVRIAHWFSNIFFQEILNSADGCPRVFGHMWVSSGSGPGRDASKQVWRKAFFVLRNSQLLFSYRMQSLDKVGRTKSKDAPNKVPPSMVFDSKKVWMRFLGYPWVLTSLLESGQLLAVFIRFHRFLLIKWDNWEIPFLSFGIGYIN